VLEEAQDTECAVSKIILLTPHKRRS